MFVECLGGLGNLNIAGKSARPPTQIFQILPLCATLSLERTAWKMMGHIRVRQEEESKHNNTTAATSTDAEKRREDACVPCCFCCYSITGCQATAPPSPETTLYSHTRTLAPTLSPMKRGEL